MNDRKSPERLLSTWFELEAPARAPDDLRDDVINATARIRPRPAWLALLKGHPMDVIVGGARRRDPRLVPALFLIGLLLVAIAGAAIVGSQPPNRAVTVVPTPAPSATASASRPSGSPTAPSPSALADVTIALPYNVLEVIAGDDAMWVSVAGEDTNELPRSIYRVDPATNEASLVLTDMPVAKTSPVAFVETAGSLWVVENEGAGMLRFDSTTGALRGEVQVGDFPIEPVVAFGAVWSLDYRDGAVTRIDPSTGAVAATIEIPQFAGEGPRAVAGGGSLLWAVTPRQDTLVGIDPATNEIAKEIQLESNLHCNVGVQAGRVWVAGCDADTPLQVFDDGTGDALGTFGGFPSLNPPLAADGDVAWVRSGDEVPPLSTHLIPVDVTTLTTADRAEVTLGVVAQSLAVGSDSLWYSFGPNLYRLPLASFATN